VLERSRVFLGERVWEPSAERLTPWRRISYRWMRIALLVYQGFARNRLHFLAFALTYMTLLSLVPILVFAFALARAFELHEKLKPLVLEQFGSGVEPVANQLLAAVDETKVAALNAVAVAFVLWAVIRGLSTFEAAFNTIWGVHRSRSLVRKFTDYLSVVVVSPLLIAVAMGTTGALESTTVLVEILRFPPIRIFASILPFVVTWAGFTFLYVFLPNTKVHLRSAIAGALVAGTVYQLTQWGYFHFQVGLTRLGALYGVFASLPFFMIWLQVAWMIVLVGCEIAYVHQHEETLRLEGILERPSVAEREREALRIVARISDQFINGGDAWDADRLARSLHIHFQLVSDLLRRLVAAGIVAETAGAVHHFVLAKDPDHTTAGDVVDSIRHHGVEWPELGADDPKDRLVDRVLSKARQSEGGVLARCTLRQLAERARWPEEREPSSEPAIP
jgi:membrane protein